MDPDISAELRQFWRSKREHIVERWHDALAQAGFVPLDGTAFEQQLTDLVNRIIELLLSDTLPVAKTQSIGAALAGRRSMPSAALGATVVTLGEQLVVGVPTGVLAALQPRLAVLLGEIATGFLREREEAIRTAQGEIFDASRRARRRAEDALRASEARYRAVVNEAAEGIILVDAGTARILEANAAFQHIVGYAAEELAGMPLDVLDAEGPANIHAGIQQTLAEGRRDAGRQLCRRKDGTLIPVEASATTIRMDGGSILCVVVRDITERIRAEAELDEARRGLTASREEERRALARELHDGAVQELTGLCYQLSSARSHIPMKGSLGEPSEEIEQVEEGMRRLIEQLRWMIAELRPTGLDECGLAAALTNYVGSLRADSGSATITLHVDPSADDLSPRVAFCLFQVAREAMRNSVKHGQARQVVVRVRQRARAAVLHVSDDGSGFDVPRRLATMGRAGHYGLVGINEEVARVEGRLRISSRPGRGIIVAVWAPLTVDGEGHKHGDSNTSG